MEEIIVCIHGTNTNEVVEALKNGWRVKLISSFCQPTVHHSNESKYGAYVVLTKGE